MLAGALGDYTNAVADESPAMPKLFWIGLAIFVLGQAPLLLIIVAVQLGLWPDPNPNPNPIGPGSLSFVTFWPGLGLMFTGLIIARRLLNHAPLAPDLENADQ